MSILRFFVLFFIAVFYSSVSHAYLDPSSGSAIVSGIIGLIAAISFTLKTYWYKLKRLFSGEKEIDDHKSDDHKSDDHKSDDHKSDDPQDEKSNDAS